MKHVALQSKIAPQFQDSAERCGSVERNYFCPKLSKWPEDAKDAKGAFLRQKEMAKRVFSGGEWKVATGKNSKKEMNIIQFNFRCDRVCAGMRRCRQIGARVIYRQVGLVWRRQMPVTCARLNKAVHLFRRLQSLKNQRGHSKESVNRCGR